MSYSRRVRFLNAYKAISTPGNPQYEQFAQLIGVHKSSNFVPIHSTQYFLPWHRWYIMALEDLLRNEDCRVTVPLWRWSKKSATWWTGTPFHPASTWLGMDGIAPNQCVNDGAFGLPWSPPGDVCLRHDFFLSTMPTGAQIANVLNLPSSSYSVFSDSLEGMIHNPPHVRIRGHMAQANSPKSPAFFLHHAYIDKLWDDWQKKSPAHLSSYDAFPMNHELIETFGTTASNIQDHFDLKQCRVIYVNYKWRSTGPGHFFFLPFCLWIVKWPSIFLLAEVEVGLSKLAAKGALNRVSQRPFHVKDISSLQKKFSWWFERQDRRSTSILNKKVENMFRLLSSANEKLVSPKEEFGDEVPKMLGYVIESVAKATNICPLGTKYDRRRRGCNEDRSESNYLDEELRKGQVVGGEVLGLEDLKNMD